jgi:uncharacterized membrane protein YfcA
VLEILGYCSSILVGVVLGMLGGGGSILSIPILVYLFNIEPVLAQAYSLFIVGITSLAGAIPKYRENLVNLKTGFLFGIPSIAAIFVTRHWIVPAIPQVIFEAGDFVFSKRELLLGLFALLMVLASFRLIRNSKDVSSDSERFLGFLLVVQGILIGFLTGLVGAGGGFLIIPALVFLTGLPFKTAVGTSLFIISINSLTGFAGDLLNHTMDWPFLLTITALAVFGILVGNYFSKRITAFYLRKIFGWFTLVVGAWILLKEFIIS